MMWRFAPLIIVLLIALACAAVLLRGGTPPPASALIGRGVPATPIDGLDAAALKKPVVVVNFFASWCAPCADEQPLLAEMAGIYDVTLLGVAYKDNRADTDQWLSRHGNPFAALGRDLRGQAALDWGVYGVPETFILHDGVVVYRHVGPLTDKIIARDLAPLLKRGVR